MARYITLARYTPEGAKAVLKESATAREAAIRRLFEASGGKLEAMYWMSGKYNVVTIGDISDDATGAVLQLAVQSAGFAGEFETIPLLSADDVDKARAKATYYKPPSA